MSSEYIIYCTPGYTFSYHCSGLEVCDVKFDQCHVAANCVLGQVGEGLKIIQTVTNHNKYLQSFAIVKYLK